MKYNRFVYVSSLVLLGASLNSSNKQSFGTPTESAVAVAGLAERIKMACKEIQKEVPLLQAWMRAITQQNPLRVREVEEPDDEPMGALDWSSKALSSIQLAYRQATTAFEKIQALAGLLNAAFHEQPNWVSSAAGEPIVLKVPFIGFRGAGVEFMFKDFLKFNGDCAEFEQLRVVSQELSQVASPASDDVEKRAEDLKEQTLQLIQRWNISIQGVINVVAEVNDKC